MWFVCLFLFVSSVSGFPFGEFRLGDKSGQFHVQLVQQRFQPRNRLCLPSPFLGPLCLPSTLQFIMPLKSIGAGRQRCLTIPLMKAYMIRVCPQKAGLVGKTLEEDMADTLKELMEEEEKEVLSSDKSNIKLEPENFVEKETGVQIEEVKVEDKNVERKNEIMKTSEEVFGAQNTKPPLTPEEFLERNWENIDITANLV